MGLLEDYKENYTTGSPISNAINLKSILMIIHGTADNNANYQSFERLTNKLRKHNKMFDMMSFPMQLYGVNGRGGKSLNVRVIMGVFWKRVLD